MSCRSMKKGTQA